LRRQIRRGWGWLGAVAVLCLLYWLNRQASLRPWNQPNPLAPAERAFAVAATMILVLLAQALGLRLVRWFGIAPQELGGRYLVAAATGLGALAYLVLALGLVGWLSLPVVLGALVGLALWLHKDVEQIIIQCIGWAQELWRLLAAQPIRFEGVVGCLLLLLIFASTLSAISPPSDYDGLMYHLAAPKAYLAAGRIHPFPLQVQANYPATLDMLYTVGLALGSDLIAPLLHLTTALLATLGLYVFGCRFFSRRFGLLAAVIFFATPKVNLIAGWAHVDLALILFLVVALYGLYAWRETGQRHWLVGMGIACGLAMGTKYYGARPTLVLGLAVLLLSRWERRQTWRAALTDAGTLAAVTTLVAAPWYLKNWIWMGNPVYPFYFGGRNWNIFRAEQWARWASTFGMGHGLTDYLLLPVRLVLYPNRFSVTPYGYLSHGLWLSPLFLLIRRRPYRRLFLEMGVLAISQFALWAVDMQEMRFVLYVVVPLSLMAAAVFDGLLMRWSGQFGLKTLLQLVPLYLMVLALSIQIFSLSGSIGVLLGTMPKAAYLRAKNYVYDGLAYLNENLPSDSRTLFLWEGQGYYCDRPYIPDPIYDRWVNLMVLYETPATIRDWLAAQSVTHVLLSEQGLRPILAQHDAGGYQRHAFEVFKTFRDEYLVQVWTDDAITLYRLRD
jgi:4-amino-4-deoxy-L-arabinose transferase-like glycosyltransferase